MYPHKRSLVKKLSGKPVVLLGVNSDKDRDTLKKTIVKEGISWRSWWDEGRTDGPIHATWQVTQRPALFVLDAKGVIRYRNVDTAELDKAIDDLLAEHAAKRGK